MYNNELYMYSNKDLKVPAHLNFGKYIFDRLLLKKGEIALVRTFTF